MAELAHHIEVRRVGSETRLSINGEPFPWHISADGIDVIVARTECPAVTIKILADRVDVVDSLDPIEEEPPDSASKDPAPDEPDSGRRAD